jgi:CheY-like chemotaxis protein
MASTAPAAKPVHRHRILFVDDDPILRQLSTGLFSANDYEVCTASDGLEALELLKQCLPDLIISDLRMPRMSGFEFLSIVRRRFPAMPLIAISGEFLSAGDPALGIADVFFAKGDYSPQQLVQRVGELIAHPLEHRGLETPPIWVPVSPSGEIVLTCTDCLRSFAVRVCPPAFGNPMRETECICCSTKLRYCVDATSLPVGQTSWATCGAIGQIVEIRDKKKSA